MTHNPVSVQCSDGNKLDVRKKAAPLLLFFSSCFSVAALFLSSRLGDFRQRRRMPGRIVCQPFPGREAVSLIVLSPGGALHPAQWERIALDKCWCWGRGGEAGVVLDLQARSEQHNLMSPLRY